LQLVERLQPDVLVLELILPGLSGLEILPIASQRTPETRLVVFSRNGEDTMVRQALRGGAICFVLKDCDPVHLVETVRRASAGQRYLSPPLSQRAVDLYAEQAREGPLEPHDTLTPREREVLQLAAEGLTNAAIARRLSISRRTVEMHRGSMMRKLGLATQTDLVRYALRRGIIPLQG
jgi:DNA-binding NarL/FixJ family response regulator